MRARNAATPALLALVLAGCGAGTTATAHQESARHTVAHGMHRMPDGTLMSDSDMAMMHVSRVAAKPSASAEMVCAAETHLALQHNLGLASEPPSSSRWTDNIYTCMYHLAGGDLVASVKDSSDVAAGSRYFDSLRARIPDLHRIRGLQSLGLPGYEDGHGTVLFFKDGKTLDVDASALPAKVGRYGESPADVAYSLAASILACWSEH